MGGVAAASGVLTGAEGLAVAASAAAGLTVSADGLAGSASAAGLTVVTGAAAAWVAASLRECVDGRVE